MNIAQQAMNNKSKNHVVQLKFNGINNNYYVGENEFYDEKNITADDYPLFSTRRQRYIYELRGETSTCDYGGPFSEPTDLFYSNGAIGFVDILYGYKTLRWNPTRYDALKDDTGNTVRLSDDPKQIVTMGGYVVIFPDKLYFNTQERGTAIEGSYTDTGAQRYTGPTVHSIDETFEDDDGNVESMIVHKNGTVIAKAESGYDSVRFVRTTLPPNPNDKDLWIDISDTPQSLKEYSATTKTWKVITDACMKLRSYSETGITNRFETGDIVHISGATELRGFKAGDYEVVKKTTDSIIVQGNLFDVTAMIEGTLKIERKAPDMDFICEHNNRIWGCNSSKHEIYASKLGSPKSFNTYQGISTDSYAVTVGSSGPFTGCCSFGGYVYFFKENTIHKIYGTKPANFQLSSIHARGVEAGSEQSICMVNETLYYKAVDCVVRFDGFLPQEISLPLGQTRYRNARAGDLWDKLYISMDDPDGNSTLFTYDTNFGIWNKEDDIKATNFTRISRRLEFLANNKIYAAGEVPVGTSGAWTVSEEDPFEWFAETGNLLYTVTDRGYISRINIRAYVYEGSIFNVAVKYDDGFYETVETVVGDSDNTKLIAITPHRSERIRLKFFGSGQAKIEAISYEIEIGSDME